jgi:hypothetical protein
MYIILCKPAKLHHRLGFASNRGMFKIDHENDNLPSLLTDIILSRFKIVHSETELDIQVWRCPFLGLG